MAVNWARDAAHQLGDPFGMDEWLKQEGKPVTDWLTQYLGTNDQAREAIFGPDAPAGSSSGQPTTPGQSQADLNALLNALLGGGTGGTGGAGSSGPAGYYTPDGVFIEENSPQDVYYRMVDAIWTKIYGQHPPFSMVQLFHDQGVENTSQLDTIMKQMPSHIKNPDGTSMPIGEYDVMKGTAETFSDKYFGRPIPDSLIQQWVKVGTTSPESIELWFLNHPAKDIPKDVYGQIFDAATEQVKQTWNDLPHPDNVSAIYNSLNAPGTVGNPTVGLTK